MGGAASGSPYAGVGLSREMVTIISCELPLVLVLLAIGKTVGDAMGTGLTFSMTKIAEYQIHNGSLILHPSMIPAAIAFLMTIPGETGNHPFDAAEAETEICEGLLAEYSGAPLGIFKLSHAVKMLTLTSMFVALFLGGIGTGLLVVDGIIVFALCGIWHGANWNFICWGLYYFVLLAAEKLFLLPHLQKGKVWPHIYTLFLVVVGWAMFVGNDAGVEFGLLFQKLFIPSGGVMPLYFLRNYGVLLAVSVLCCTPLIEKLWDLLSRHAVTKALTILALLTISMAYVVGSTNSPFLYFNF